MLHSPISDSPAEAGRDARKWPIIICGAGRSGTRMTVRLVSKHPGILITDEYPEKCLLNAFALLKNTEDYLAARPKRFERVGWPERRAKAMLDLWLGASTVPAWAQAGRVLQIGNKTPWCESYFRSLEAVFAEAKPRYLYCVRHPELVLRSYKNMPWNHHSVRQNWSRWKASVAVLQEMERVLPDRVLRVQWDRIEEGRTLDMARRIYDFLELDLSEALEKKIAKMEKAQPVTSIVDGPVVELTPWERRLVRWDRRYGLLLALLGYERR